MMSTGNTMVDALDHATTRRHLIRKAAYTAPVAIIIAAAPQVAFGQSGNAGRGNGAEGNPDQDPGNSGNHNRANDGGSSPGRGRGNDKGNGKGD